jgi:hypothetical protein
MQIQDGLLEGVTYKGSIDRTRVVCKITEGNVVEDRKWKLFCEVRICNSRSAHG